MKRAITGTLLMTCTGWLTFGQSSDAPAKFEIADIHPSAKTTFAFARSGPARGGRYEVKNANMVDLIRMAYGFDQDKILGGPNWLEMDRFDVIAKMPADTTPETQKLMLQALLEDRFKLVTHKDTRPLPTYALTVGKKPQLKEADGTEESGCKPQAASGAPAEGGVRLMMGNANGTTTTLNLGPGMTIQYMCRNMTMAAFAAGLRGMMGANVGPNPVLDETELKGNWNFDLKYSMQMMGPMMNDTSDRVSIFAAVDKQLGLKLEQKQVPTPVIVVDKVNQKPSENPPGVAEALPTPPVPTEFEVASIKPTDPAARMGRFQMQPGGRLMVEGMNLRFLINRAFNTNNNDEVVGVPAFATTDRYDITAKTPPGSAQVGNMDMEAMAPMILSLLKDRFKMTYHTEDRPVTAYALAAGKPKMKKADPASRISCKNPNPPPGSPPRTRVLTCQNITMAQFADRLQNMSPELNWPVADATGIEGGWDFTLTFSMSMPVMMGPGPARAAGGGGGGGGGEGAAPGGVLPSASDPTDSYTLIEALEKQLGLKLEKQKRTLPVIVIDHLEQKPTEN
jgi:uncharacterized protein (TIGR03435 family)